MKTKVVIVGMLVIVLMIFGFGMSALNKLERIVQIAERTEQKIDVAIKKTGERVDAVVKTLAPLGNETVKKGIQIVKEVDGGEIGDAATSGMKEIGAAAKSRLIDLMKKKE